MNMRVHIMNEKHYQIRMLRSWQYYADGRIYNIEIETCSFLLFPIFSFSASIE
jgi:hypothetical protein